MTGVLAMVGFTVLPGPAASVARRPQARPRRPDSRRPLTWHWPAVRRRRVPRDVPHSPSDPATPSAVALADAIRQQLTHPGSVSPQRQLELILADRMADGSGSAGPGRARPGWTPFLVRTDPCPYRPLQEGSWLTSNMT